MGIENEKPSGRASLLLSDVIAGPLKLKAVRFDLTLKGNSYTIEGSLIRPDGEPMGRFVVGGIADLKTRQISATLKQLQGKFRGLALNLKNPVSISIPAGLALTQKPLQIPAITIDVNKGRLEIGGQLSFIDQQGELRLSHVDLQGTLGGISPGRITGRPLPISGLKGSFRVEGSPLTPDSSFELSGRLRKLRFRARGGVRNQRLKLRAAELRRCSGEETRWANW